MKTWTMAEAKRDFEKDLLTGFQIFDSTVISSNVQHWSVSFSSTLLGIDGAPLVDWRTKQDRRFRTLDAAIGAVRAVGFHAQILVGSR